MVDDAYGEVSEFFTAELATVLNVGRGTAAYRQGRALHLAAEAAAHLRALKAGELDERRAAALADVLQHTNPDVAGQVEAALLPEATDLSVARLKARATEEMLRLDAAAAEERRKDAEKSADVQVYPSGIEGRSTLAADLPTDEAVECYDLVDQLAKMLKADGDDRPIGALRAHVLSLLIRRPGDHGLPPVRANVTVMAALDALEGGTTPGEVNGLPITAGHLRELLARIGALGLTAPEDGTLSFAITGPDGELLATLTPAELARLAKRGCPSTPTTSCGCPVTGPAATDGRLHADRPATGLRHHPRPALPVPQLRATRRLGRPRPRRGPCLRRRDRLHQPVLPVPLPPPAEDLRPRLAASP